MLAIGGAMANTFLAAQGINIGTSICEQNLFDSSLRIIELAKEHGCDVVLPVDVITARNLTSSEECKVVQATQVDDQDMMLDIGPKTIAIIAQKLETAKTIVWNGPMGAFEYRPFDIGTISLARYVAGLTNSGQITSVVGGGDIVSALTMGGLAKNFSYISTGGGAFLEWLEGKQLPGINALLSS
jgi:phosphoglycerate kinase